MPRSTALAVTIVLFPLVGCGFAPAGSGGSGASGGPLGTGNASGTGLVGGGAAQNGQGNVTGMNCREVMQPLNKLPPDILIIQDASGSMNDDPSNAQCNNGCGATSKWAQMTPAINQVVTATDTTVNWGLKFFADTDATCGVGNNVAVGVAANNGTPVANAIMGDVQRLWNENTLVTYSTQGVIHEVDKNKMLLQSLSWGTGGALGYVVKRQSLYGPSPK